jgi:hypothetical protein
MNEHFVVSYVQACGTGKLALSECAAVWQMGVIGLLLVSAIAALLVLRMRDRADSAQA